MRNLPLTFAGRSSFWLRTVSLAEKWFVFALGLLLMVCAPNRASASAISCVLEPFLFVDGGTSNLGFGTQMPCGSVSAMSSGTLAGPQVESQNGLQTPLFTQTGSLTGSGTANFGQLSGSANVSTGATPKEYDYTLPNGQATAVDNPYYAQSGVGAFEQWSDSITVTDPKLPAGSLVSFRLSTSLVSSVQGTPSCFSGGGYNDPLFGSLNFDIGASAGAQFSIDGPGGANSSFLENACPGPSLTQQSQVLSLQVGGRYAIGGSLQVSAASTAGFRPGASGLFYQDSGASAVAASGGAFFRLDPLTSGASYVSESGATYLTPTTVPEPSSVLVFGSGLLGLMILARGKLLS